VKKKAKTEKHKEKSPAVAKYQKERYSHTPMDLPAVLPKGLGVRFAQQPCTSEMFKSCFVKTKTCRGHEKTGLLLTTRGAVRKKSSEAQLRYQPNAPVNLQ